MNLVHVHIDNIEMFDKCFVGKVESLCVFLLHS